MIREQKHIRLDQPAIYQIEVQGQLDPQWSAHFGGMDISIDQDDSGLVVTRLYGKLADQASLHGMLCHIRDLGLPLLAVQFIRLFEEGLPGEEQSHD
jgi:hypothetical protein